MRRTKDLCLVAMMATLIAVCAWITIPAPVPFTLQTFAVFSALALLGGARGTAAVGLYLLLGALGLPVFSGFSGGLGVLLGATGGYLFGFLLIGLCRWLFEARAASDFWRTASLVLGLALCYAFGTAWFLLVYARANGPLSLLGALSWCVFPFVLPDLAKLALALTLAGRVARHLRLE